MSLINHNLLSLHVLVVLHQTQQVSARCIVVETDTALVAAQIVRVEYASGHVEHLQLSSTVDDPVGTIEVLPSIPISQKTIEICEELDTDPYLIGAGGCILMITKNAEELLKALWEAGAEAADIGRLCEGHAKELRNGEEVRFLEPLRTKKNANQ